MRTALEDVSTESTLNAVSAGIVLIDTAGLVVRMNGAAEALTGWPGSEAVGRPWANVLNFPQGLSILGRSTSQGALPQVDEGYDPIDIAGPLYMRNGESLPVLLQQLPWFDNDGVWRGYVFTLHDMSAVQDQIRLREELLSNIAHEFRTPLASLVASTEMLSAEHHEMSSAEIDHLLRSLHRSIRRLESMVSNILDEASLRAGRFQIYPEPIEVADMIEEAVLFVRPMLDQREQVLEVRLQAGLDAVRADEQRIAQVLINLLDNASKYGGRGQSISLRASSADDFVKIVVVDQGPGIAKAEQKALFERFSRLGRSGASTSGTGLGLAIAKAIVERHGGQIGLESDVGRGTCVWFTLPWA